MRADSGTVTALTGMQRLRYDVFCTELGFLDPKSYADGRERDRFDPFSVQVGATDARGDLVGTLRLVLDSPLGFPFESHAHGLFPEFATMPRERTAEISRLIVARDYRALSPTSVRLLHPVLMLLFRSMYQSSLTLGLEYWLAAMDRTLHRTLRHLLGFSFQPIGPPMEYHGEVLPYAVSIRYVETTLARTRPDQFLFFGGQSNLVSAGAKERTGATPGAGEAATEYRRHLQRSGLGAVTVDNENSDKDGRRPSGGR